MIKISVIIPMYKVEQYIQKCIDSVYNQGYKESAFEIIAIDDESPDNSLSLVNEISKNHNNITVVSQKNKGLGGARNTGIEYAKGTYLLFLDADDYLLPNALKEIIDIAIKYDLDILEFGAQGVLPNGAISYEVSKCTNGTIYNGVTYYNNLKYMNSACNKLYNRELLVTNNIKFIEKIYIEDFEFNTRVFFYSKKVMAIKNIVAHYLQSPNSITRNTSKEKKAKMLSDILLVLKVTKEFSQNVNLSNPQVKNYFNTRLSFLNVTIFYQLFKNKNSYKTVLRVKSQLKEQHLFYINNSISDTPKDIFRILMLNNIWLFKITQPLQKLLYK
ncbi:glycosyltransferase family 2 protein [Mariniflexile soesokkakense]|uniref:Glycosyltransferase family 2 protein n=1 Tax=Mariniflexile soesokkakense TaxID=1343160 RepID=A0ABV0ACU0_9FLAO